MLNLYSLLFPELKEEETYCYYASLFSTELFGMRRKEDGYIFFVEFKELCRAYDTFECGRKYVFS